MKYFKAWFGRLGGTTQFVLAMTLFGIGVVGSVLLFHLIMEKTRDRPVEQAPQAETNAGYVLVAIVADNVYEFRAGHNKPEDDQLNEALVELSKKYKILDIQMSQGGIGGYYNRRIVVELK